MTPEALARWRSWRVPDSHWRMSARGRMFAVARKYPDLVADDDALLKAIDKAYPFGERRHHPYKCWLEERRLLIELMNEAPPPSRTEAEVCSVARDELELHPERAEAIREMLDEHAPNRLRRQCPACGVRAGVSCVPVTQQWPVTQQRRCARCGWSGATDEMEATSCPRCHALSEDDLLVPHHARLVGHRDAGPLFERSP